MMPRQRRGNLYDRLERAVSKAPDIPTEEEERDRVEREITMRLWRVVFEVMDSTRAGGGRRGGNPMGPIQIPIVEKEHGPDWTYRQWNELVIERALTRGFLEKALSTGGAGSNVDLRPYFDFSEEHIESLKETWLEALHELHDQMCPDEPLDEANRWFREKKEKAIEEEWNV